MRLIVEGNPDLVRDSYSKAIISTDANGAAKYYEQRKLREATEKRISSVEDSLKEVVESVTEIKQMIAVLLDKTGK